jgi:hypothetical protein
VHGTDKHEQDAPRRFIRITQMLDPQAIRIGDRMTRDQLIKFHEEFCDRARAIVAAKNHDYCQDGDPFGNFRASAVLGVDPGLAILVRCLDKFKRVQTFIEKGELRVPNEGVDDALQDVVNYMVLLAGMISVDRNLTAELGQ